jgi:hypothetical protein
MPASKSRRKPTAWIVAALLMFAQGLDVAQACLAPERPQMAFEQQDCHKPSNPNHCLKQCTADNLGTSPAQIAVPAVVVLLSPLIVPAAAPTPVGLRADVLATLAGSDPPLPIRHCSFLL